LNIPNIIYEGPYTIDLVNDVKNNTYNLSEGVVCKGLIKEKKEKSQSWSTKVKTNEWIQKVKQLYGDKYLLEEFNNDIKMIKEYE
jgi:hypothetical protein